MMIVNYYFFGKEYLNCITLRSGYDMKMINDELIRIYLTNKGVGRIL